MSLNSNFNPISLYFINFLGGMMHRTKGSSCCTTNNCYKPSYVNISVETDEVP